VQRRALNIFWDSLCKAGISKYFENEPLPRYRAPREQLLRHVEHNGGNQVEQTGSHALSIGNGVIQNGNIATRTGNQQILKSGNDYSIIGNNEARSEDHLKRTGNHETPTGNYGVQHGSDLEQIYGHKLKTGSTCSVNMGRLDFRWREEEEKLNILAQLSKVDSFKFFISLPVFFDHARRQR